MQISRVRLKNFRQFYGTQELRFTSDGKKNVTLVHAENGFGKTSILNAVLWCLFKEVTPRFERADEIVNYEALEEGETSAMVEVEIEFKGTRYVIQRTFFSNREGRDRTALSVSRNEAGNLRPLPAAETFVASVIPPEMAKYFFFDGETAESFAAARNHKAIAGAIRTILGCSLADTAIDDLADVAKNVDREIGDSSGDERIKTLEDSLSRKQTEVETCVSLRETLIQQIDVLKDQYEEVVQSLREAAAAAQIQRERDEKNALKQQAEADIRECRQEVLRWIGQRAVQVVSGRLTQVALDFVDEASLRGRIPSPYNEDFVRGLLKSGICICHRPLESASAQWTAVADLLRTAANAEVLNRVVRARSRSTMLSEEGADAPKRLHEIQARLASRVTARNQLEQQIEELGRKIEGLPLQEIADRERSRRTLEARIERLNQELGGAKGHLVELQREKDALGEEIDELARKNKRTVRLYAKRKLVMRASGLLSQMLKAYEQEARQKIEGEVNGILETVAHKDFRCRLSDGFAIELLLNDRSTAKSAGENQLLSLAFIAALVRFAAERIDSEDPVLQPGTIAPLVLDAPLGQLDPRYQESVAVFLPKLARQVVLLVSGSQGGDRVLSALRPSIGAEYVLIQENRGSRGKKESLTRVFDGRERDLILFGQKHTMTRIERVS